MRSDRPKKDWFQRFIRWAEGEDSTQDWEVAEDPERAEFMEYLEYLDSHKHMDFGAYRLMRYRERAAKGMVQEEYREHQVPTVPAREGLGVQLSRHRPGQLRKLILVYRALSLAVAGVLMVVLAAVALALPAFGDREAPALNQVAGRYLEKGVEETGAVNIVAGMILDYRAFDTFGESTVLFAASVSTALLLSREKGRREQEEEEGDSLFRRMGRLILPAVMVFGIYVAVNGHLSPGGGFSGGTVLGCGLILGSLSLGRGTMERLLPSRRVTRLSVGCLLAYGVMKGYSFVSGANHIGPEIPKGTPGAILSGGLILPLNLCVGVIVACTMYTFYTLFSQREE